MFSMGWKQQTIRNYRFTFRLLEVWSSIKFEFEGYVWGFNSFFYFLVDVLSAGWFVAVALSQDFLDEKGVPLGYVEISQP